MCSTVPLFLKHCFQPLDAVPTNARSTLMIARHTIPGFKHVDTKNTA